MDSSELTRRRVNQLFYTNYLFQQTRVNGGCSSRVQLQTLAGGGAMDASLIPVLKNGEIGTTIPQYQQIVEAATCPPIPVSPTGSTGSTGSTGTSEYSYVFGTFTNDTLAVYDANHQQTFTLSKDVGLYNTTYLVKYDSSGTPIWGAKMGFTFNTYGQSARFNWDMSSVYAKGSYVYVACVVSYSYSIGQTIDLYDAGGTTPSLTLTFNLINSNTAYDVLILAKYDLNGVVQWANYINTMSSSGSTDPSVLNQIHIKRSNIHVDQNDNVYVGFHFNETLAINKNPAVIDDRESIGVYYGSTTYDGILIKYSPSGIYQWYLDAGVNSVGSITNSIVAVTDIISDSSGNVYVAYISSLAESVDFFPSSDSSQSVFTLPPDSVNRWFNMFVKVNTLGVIQWGTIIRTGGASGKAMIALDSSQNLYVAAMYGWGGYLEVFNQNSFTSPAITSPFSSQGDIDLALIKYTSAGIAQWATYLAGANKDQQPVISINSQNKITILGATNSNSVVIYDTSSNVTPASTLTMTSGGYKIFFAEFDTSGVLQKKAYFGPVTPTQNPRPDFQHGINHSLYITVGMEPNVTAILYDSTNTNTITFTNNILVNSFASRIVIVVKYDSSFTPQWLTYLADNSLPQIATSSS